MNLHVLTLVLVLLKAFGVISISWWWVAAPSLVMIAFGTAFLLLALVIVVMGAVMGALYD